MRPNSQVGLNRRRIAWATTVDADHSDCLTGHDTIHIMPSHDELRRVRELLSSVLDDMESGRSDDEIRAALADRPRGELLRVRRLIDQQLARDARPLPIEVIDGGLPIRDLLADELGLDHAKVRRVLTFIDEYVVLADSLGRSPTIPEVAAETQQSVATVNRRLAEFRAVFADEHDPLRIGRVLRHALDNQSLWDSIDDSINATIGDVPVMPRVRSASARWRSAS